MLKPRVCQEALQIWGKLPELAISNDLWELCPRRENCTGERALVLEIDGGYRPTGYKDPLSVFLRRLPVSVYLPVRKRRNYTVLPLSKCLWARRLP